MSRNVAAMTNSTQMSGPTTHDVAVPDPLDDQAPLPDPTHPDPSMRGAVVVGVDGSEDAARAVAWAGAQAGLEGRPVVLVHASSLSGHSIYPGAEYLMMDDRAIAAVTADSQRVLSEATEAVLQVDTGLRVSGLDLRTEARETLVRASTVAHVVVVGSRGRGHTASLLLGSVSASVAARASCPVVIVRPPSEGVRTPGVVVGVRFSPNATTVVEHAFVQASLRGVPLTVVHFYFDTEASEESLAVPEGSSALGDELRRPMAEAVAGLAERYPDVEVHVDLAEGGFRRVLAGAAGHHDLLVIGRRSGNALGRAIGTWSTLSIVEHASGTVLVVPESTS